jgi:diguanylate cyclase
MNPRSVRRLGVKAFARARNLAGRLTRAALESAAIALVVAGVGINVLVYTWSHATLQSDAGVLAQMTADNAAAAVMFGDSRTAVETLTYLRGSQGVVQAVIYDAHGQVFATYRAEKATNQQIQASFSVDALIAHQGKSLGRIQLQVTTERLNAELMRLAGITTVSVLVGLVVAFMRISRVRRAVKRTEAELDQLAFFDQVTGLHNRHAGKEFIDERVADPYRRPMAVALLDMDDFKLVNDTLGHKAGDDLLRSLGARLRDGCQTRNGVVFRLGGDEFIIVWDHIESIDMLPQLGQELVALLGEAIVIADQAIFVRASVGLAAFPTHGTNYTELLRAADTAMYQAKAAGKNTYAIYNQAMAQKSTERLRLATELGLAIERNELTLHYQPIVDIASQALVGVEALVRWNHPLRGLLNPVHFIEVAEESGQVVDLGGWVLCEAARQQAAWQREGLGHLFIAVNVSAMQFKRSVLLAQVQAALHQSGAAPSQLHVELTEHTLVEDMASNVEQLAQLRDLGIKVAIDDFGTGLSSLAYLKRLPIDKLKIDRSFVSDLATSGHEDTAIVTAIVTLAHALNLDIVAEGIETEAQLECLSNLGVEQGQGFLFSRPVPAEHIASLVQSSRSKLLQHGSDTEAPNRNLSKHGEQRQTEELV